jgi:membrane fusion protein, macrolide-specific efflux system
MLHKKFNRGWPNRKALALTCTLITVSQLLTGCGVLPEKEEPKLSPILKEVETQDYNYVYVEQGDIVLKETIYCTYSQLNEESLSFPFTGKTIKNVYYSTGDTVKKGDLLAELDLGSTESDIKNLEYSIGKTNLLLSQAKELMSLDIEKQQIIAKDLLLSEGERKQAISNVKNQYNQTINSYEDSLYISNMKLESLKEKCKSYRLYASMDGTLSYVKKNLEGSQTTKDDVLFTIIDNSTGAFKAETEFADKFKEGEEVIVTKNNIKYPVKVMHSSTEENVVYFNLITPDLQLDIGNNGYVDLILDERLDTLYLPSSVIYKMNDSYYVYYIDETGVQNIKTVEIGIQGDGKVEILSGLNYNDAVIKKK